ncbi:MAG: amidohydrolase family protein [Desulfofustis sp.]|nr:amidohydrolase family protein [Desulfofustis sp.]
MQNSQNQYIRVGSLIDGRGGPVRKDQLITIKSGSIAEIDNDTFTDPIPAEQLTDLSHCVVLPVLIDSHVHLCMSGSIDMEYREKQLNASYEELVPIIAEHLRHQFSHGVLGLRDSGDRGGHVLRYLGELFDSEAMPVRVLSPGRAYHRCGRYGSLIGVCLESDESLLETFLRLAQPTKLVKVVNSGLNSLTRYALQTEPQFSTGQLRELVTEARRRDARIMVHANGEVPVRTAIEAGCNSIEHGFFMGRRNLELMAARGVYWVPTVYTMKAVVQNAEHYRTTIDKKVAERNLAHQLEQLGLARELGVKVAIGTDSGSMGVLHGESMVEEMKLFIQAGFSLSETIRCATDHGARLLGLEELGTLEPGKPAHFLATRGTPAQLPRKLSYLEKIYLHGNPSEAYRRDPDYTTLRKFEGVAFSGKVKY